MFWGLCSGTSRQLSLQAYTEQLYRIELCQTSLLIILTDYDTISIFRFILPSHPQSLFLSSAEELLDPPTCILTKDDDVDFQIYFLPFHQRSLFPSLFFFFPFILFFLFFSLYSFSIFLLFYLRMIPEKTKSRVTAGVAR
jgi:hypothetical protein